MNFLNAKSNTGFVISCVSVTSAGTFTLLTTTTGCDVATCDDGVDQYICVVTSDSVFICNFTFVTDVFEGKLM